MSSEKTTISPVSQGKSIETPRGVVIKLFLHTIMMIILPLTTYFYTSKYYFEGENKTTYAALSAAGIANVIVFSFIITAILEDSRQKLNKENKEE